MMNCITWLTIVASVSGVPQEPVSDQHKIHARVDPRVELMCIIFRLAGNNEYNQPSSKSPYSDEVEAHFDKHRNHAVIQTARNLRKARGVSYDAVMSMAVHIQDTVGLKEKVPFDKSPPNLDQRWRLDEAREFLEQARDFVKATGFNEFFAAHQKLYAAAAERMASKLNERALLKWFDKFFGSRPGAEFGAIVGMLNGGCCYGSSLRHLDGREQISPVLGVWQFDDDGIPVINDGIIGTAVHEFCHSYTNPLADKYAEQLAPAGKRIFPHCAAAMRGQAYGSWQTVMRESLVRVCVVRYMRATSGALAASKEIKRQHGRGFKWMGALSMLVEEYEADRERYKTFDAFMPRVVEFFNEHAKEYAESPSPAPKVVSMTPPNGATDVDPNLKEIKVVFDRPMIDENWAVVGGGPHFPEITGQVHYDKECKVFTMPVRLKPGWSYQFWLNRGKFNSFQSKEGVPLESVAVTFETRDK
jgi:hypothetical protein